MRCEYCRQEFVGSKFHPNNCQQCGAEKPVEKPYFGSYCGEQINDLDRWIEVTSCNDTYPVFLPMYLGY